MIISDCVRAALCSESSAVLHNDLRVHVWIKDIQREMEAEKCCMCETEISFRITLTTQ